MSLGDATPCCNSSVASKKMFGMVLKSHSTVLTKMMNMHKAIFDLNITTYRFGSPSSEKIYILMLYMISQTLTRPMQRKR
mmetsp:Transcript_15385/g.20292  ORF Transcript_15385/g.20292 Transcript_15385/m.20292 type:complete len:80 (+) Transcript_15385:444-683(+)